MMLMSPWMQMRYVFTRCVGVLVYFGCQGLLDEGDSSMEDEETESKVSESVMFVVYCLVQVGAGDHVVTITEEAPTNSGDQVSVFMCLKVVCWFLQGEKCFCAKSDKCPTISETNGSVSPDTDKVCGSFIVLYCMSCCVIIVG